MKRAVSFILCLFMLMSVITVCPSISEKAIIKTLASEYNDKSGDLNAPSPTKEQIKTMWENITTYENKYDIEPSTVAPYSIGKLNADYLQNGEDYLNLIRYIAGLPAIELSDELNESAQYGAVLLAASEFSHYPSQPADMDDDFYSKGVSATSSSNVAWGYGSIASSILGYMSDEDPGNISDVGHRRWLLNPKLLYVGFGEAKSRFATKVFDQSGSGVDYNFISWPSSGNFPMSMFSSVNPWSITLNPSKYSKIQDLKITLTRTSDGKVWNFDSDTSNDPNTSGNFLNVNMSGYGVSNAIIFRPAVADIVNYKGIYTVELSGVYDKNDNSVTIRYQTDFFDYNDSYHVVSYPKTVGGECTIGCDECDYTRSFETQTEMKPYWNNDGGYSWSTGFKKNLNVGDKAYMDDFSGGVENDIIVVVSDETAITYSEGSSCDYIFEFKKDGIYSITVYYKYAPCMYRTYVVYVGNTEGMKEPEPFKHYSGYPVLSESEVASNCTQSGSTAGTKCAVCGEIFSGFETIPARGHTIYVISYPKTKGGDCTISCENCDYNESFATNTGMNLWWNTNAGSGYYYSSFSKSFQVGDVLYLWDNEEIVDISTEKIINVSDESAILYKFTQGGYSNTFTFAKEGVYTFTIYYKYAPHVYRTYTVYVGNTDGMEVPEPMIPHGGTTTVVVEPNCTQGGYTMDKCSVCEYARQYYITDPDGHNTVIDKGSDPTCEDVGYTEGSHCGTCGEVFVAQTEIPANGHTEVIQPYVAPTCEGVGYTEGIICGVCGKVIKAQEEIPVTGHKTVTDKATEPTCEDVGYTEGSHCDTCGKVFVAQTEIPANGHDFQVASYPEFAGEKCILVCHCGCEIEIETPSEISVLWNRDGGEDYFNEEFYDIFKTPFNVDARLFGLNLEAGGLGGEIVIEVSDPQGITWEYTDEKFVFEFLKEGTYTFTIYYKYSPSVSKTYTVNVEELDINSVKIGDVNEDGVIDKKDYALVKRYCFNTAYLTPAQLVAADINGDGEVNKQDYALLKRACFGTYTIN